MRYETGWQNCFVCGARAFWREGVDGGPDIDCPICGRIWVVGALLAIAGASFNRAAMSDAIRQRRTSELHRFVVTSHLADEFWR